MIIPWGLNIGSSLFICCSGALQARNIFFAIKPFPFIDAACVMLHSELGVQGSPDKSERDDDSSTADDLIKIIFFLHYDPI
jgi:hypothetical protein